MQTVIAKTKGRDMQGVFIAKEERARLDNGSNLRLD